MKPQRVRVVYSSMRSVLVFFCLFSATIAAAQSSIPPIKTVAPTPAPENIRVLEETKDAHGNTIRTIQYTQGRDRFTERIIIPPPPKINLHAPINPDTMNKDSVMIVVNKSKYNVEVYYRRKLIRMYKAVFGPNPQENKLMAGDRCTPEGWFTIQTKNPKSKYNKFMLLSYPNDSALARFHELKASGKIPKNANIGGNIGIHGIWKGGDDMIDMGVCWTDGCVAIRNKDIEELYELTGVGTRVFIRK